jgi:hypothetical protein
MECEKACSDFDRLAISIYNKRKKNNRTNNGLTQIGPNVSLRACMVPMGQPVFVSPARGEIELLTGY